MINELPVVGKRYKRFSDKDIWYCRETYHRHEPNPIRYYILQRASQLLKENADFLQVTADEFFCHFEELPEDKVEIQSLKDAIQDNLQRFEKEKSSLPTWAVILINQLQSETKPETQSHISETSLIPSNSRELSPEVKEAMNNLKYHAGITNYFDKETALDDIKDAAKRLLNALDKQFANNKTQAEEVADNKIEAESNLLNFMYEKINNQNFSAELVFYLGQLIVEVCILKDRVKKLENK